MKTNDDEKHELLDRIDEQLEIAYEQGAWILVEQLEQLKRSMHGDRNAHTELLGKYYTKRR